MNFLQNINKKIIIIFLFLILLGIVLITNYLTKKQTTPTIKIVPTILPIRDTTEKNPSYKKNVFIPTYTPEKGRGVDLEAPLVADSIKEIQKIYPFLPYEKTIKTSSNKEITIIIPDKISQINKWTLQINIFGLDYHLTKGNMEYIATKNSFRDIYSSLNKWIEEKGADPKKIMIIWGDEEYIQNKSQEWLE